MVLNVPGGFVITTDDPMVDGGMIKVGYSIGFAPSTGKLGNILTLVMCIHHHLFCCLNVFILSMSYLYKTQQFVVKIQPVFWVKC